MDWTNTLFSFRGRLNRQPFWLAYLATTIVLVGLIFAIISILGTWVPVPEAPGTYTIDMSIAGWIPVGLLYLVALWTGLAISVKRIHDRNRSGWFLLLLLVPLLGLWPMIEMYFLRGTEGPNSYGPDPIPN